MPSPTMATRAPPDRRRHRAGRDIVLVQQVRPADEDAPPGDAGGDTHVGDGLCSRVTGTGGLASDLTPARSSAQPRLALRVCRAGQRSAGPPDEQVPLPLELRSRTAVAGIAVADQCGPARIWRRRGGHLRRPQWRRRNSMWRRPHGSERTSMLTTRPHSRASEGPVPKPDSDHMRYPPSVSTTSPVAFDVVLSASEHIRRTDRRWDTNLRTFVSL
jgi:hypothetical protein